MAKNRGLINGKVLEDKSVDMSKLKTESHTTDEKDPKSLVTVEFLMEELKKLKGNV